MYYLVLVAFSLMMVQGYEVLNEDQRLDEINYITSRRSKRSLCENVRPTKDPSCAACWCDHDIPLIVGKRMVQLKPQKYQRCADYNKCCLVQSNGHSSSIGSNSTAKQMASELLAVFGKRSSADEKFKKPSVDLIFLIDDSGSIHASQFKVAKDGAATLSQSLCPKSFGSGKGQKQVAVVLFSSTPQTMLTFEESQKGAGHVEHTILNMKQRSGMTATTDGIKHLRENVIGKGSSRLNDSDTATIVFVITDGQCNSRCNHLYSEAQKLRESGPGVQVFAFGIGEADCTELETIRGKDSGKVFGLSDFNSFEKLALAVKEQMAENGGVCVK